MVVATSLLFAWVPTLLYPIWTIVSEGSSYTSFDCANACRDSDPCGGFVWRNTQPLDSRCLLVVDWSVAGATSSTPSGAYRLNTYRGNFTLVQILSPGRSWNAAYSACDAKGLRLLPHPISLKDRASLSIRSFNRMSLDIQRLDDDSYVTWTSREPVPESELEPWRSGNPHKGNERCISLLRAKIEFADWYCGSSSDSNDQFCVY